ncbi:aspartyl protease family protein [Hyunsoonleella aestuarii]|uniref:Aspartyl protease family protein n=1 Tax=Hyunsoonleella aestuarii TaxID=912802 RepID=A0ABP8ED07_9FLAO|nr:aspartyl protease family protein [Hyunsoonleella aestuarii]
MSKAILKMFLFIVLASQTHAQKTKFKSGTSSPRNYYSEIKYEDVNGKIVIPVSINNKTYRFLFDTGAPNVISSGIFETLNIEKSTEITVSDANNNKQNMKNAIIPSLTIGDVIYKNSQALVFDDTNNIVFNCFEIDGIIGTNLLRKSIVKILPKENLLVLTNDRKRMSLSKDEAIDMVLRGGQSSPYISIGLQGENNAKEFLLLDTGASGFYDMCKKNYSTLKERNVTHELGNSIGASSLGMFGATKESVQYRVQIPTIKIVNHEFKNVITTTGNDDNSRIGSDILKYGDMTLDFRNKKFYFNPFEKQSDLDEKLFGFTPTIAENKLIVGMVWNEDLKEHMSYGDEILKVNDTDLAYLDLCHLLTMPSLFKNESTINITFKNENDEVNTMTLHRE